MPENEFSKLRPHPAKALPGTRPAPHAADGPAQPWAQLAATSNYTFLTGASHPEELVQQAAALGYTSIAVADRNTLGGIIRAHVAAKQHGIRLTVGSRILLQPDGNAAPPHCFLYPTSMEGYRALCRLLTLGKRRAPKGQCHLFLNDLHLPTTDLLLLMLPDRAMHQRTRTPIISPHTRSLAERFAGRCYLAATIAYDGNDKAWLRACSHAASNLGVTMAATTDAHYHLRERRMLHDVLACIRLGCTLAEAGLNLHPGDHLHLHAPGELYLAFAQYPGAIRASLELANRTVAFSLDQLRYEYPSEVVPEGITPIAHLSQLTWAGAAERYANISPTSNPATPPAPPMHQADAYTDLCIYQLSPTHTQAHCTAAPHIPPHVPPGVVQQIQHELALIESLHYESYFLTVHDLVLFARSRGIVCQGRGAAANSAVCYCLGITAVDPTRVSMLFERFISKERDEPPDIDIDFEHERREEVIQYIYAKYGRERAALTAVVISYRRRSAVRDVGKTLGLSLDLVDRLAKDIEWWDGGGKPARDGEALSANGFVKFGLNPNDPTLLHLARLVDQILGFPRHLSQHVGGFVITRTPLCELCPIENASMPDRTVIEWDKDDVDAAGMLKVDVLGLGMLTCISKCLRMVNETYQPTAPPLTLATIPAEDQRVYDMMCRADTVGVFQIESRAQMSMLPRLRPRCYYDLVIEVALVRPGPIQGDMVHPYLRRRDGIEPVNYPDEHVQRVLARTLGVPLFQEQCMALAIACAGFSAGEADQLRRAMAAWKRKGDLIYRFGQKIIQGMTARGYERTFAEKVFSQIKGFSEYGFPESHAASFALIVYSSAYMKHYYPAAFAASLINSQPMGFYAPAQIISDAKAHGVITLPIDCNLSQWNCTLEPTPRGPALRLGMRLVKGLQQREALALCHAVQQRGGFTSLTSLWRASGVTVATLRHLARADAFASLGIIRQHALWQLQGMSDAPLPLFDALEQETQQAPAHASPTHVSINITQPPIYCPVATHPALPILSPASLVISDYASTGLSLKAHPLSFARPDLTQRRVITTAQCATIAHHSRVAVAGLVLVRQRPSTARGIVFITIEDETGIANLIVRPAIYERFRREARHSAAILARGRIERKAGVVHLLVSQINSLDDDLAALTNQPLTIHQRNFR